MTEHTEKLTEVDVVVLGVGTGGEDLSLQLLDAGLDVVGIEASLVGGECPYWACIPSKMMIRAANMIAEARRIEGMAGRAEVHPDWEPVARRVRQATGRWDDTGAVERYQKRGGRLVHGQDMIYAFPTYHCAIGEALGGSGRGVTTVLDPEYDGVRRLDEL